MLKTALNTNKIPHIWKLTNIVPIPKPNKYIDKGTSYRPISLLSVIAKTLERSLLPCITANIPNTPTQHRYKIQHSTMTVLHTLNNTASKGINQMAPPAQTITVAFDMSKSFDKINIHTLIGKLLQTKISCTIIKLIANYIKQRKAYTTYMNHTSSHRQFKTGVACPFTHTIQPFHCRHTPPRASVQAWSAQMTSPSYLHTQAQVQPRNTYNHTYIQFLPRQNKQSHTKSRQNNLHSVHSRRCSIREYSGPQNKQHCTTHGNVH